MSGRARVDSVYSHDSFRAPFAVTITGTPASLAADILHTGFADSQTAWSAYFGANYPRLPDTAVWYISTGSNASGLTSVASSGVTFATEAIPANSRSAPSFLNDLSKVKLATADATLVIEG